MLIFEKSEKNRTAKSQMIKESDSFISKKYLRKKNLKLPEVSELQVVRHYTNLSRKNFSIDTNFYPLGSCTMKYNPRGVHKAASFSGFLNAHPMQNTDDLQGTLSCLYELQEMLKEISGMSGVALSSMAGAQGEFTGIAMIKKYHESRNDKRTEMLVPDAAHGTNPASAAMCGFSVKEIKTGSNGDLDIEELKKVVNEKTAGIMLTNPSTLGVFDRNILKVSKIIHDAGALMYYDGANLNAILGKVRPSDMGFDVMHMNLHKTFATPHGGGGPGCGPVAAMPNLEKFLPTPIVAFNEKYYLLDENTNKDTIGRMATFLGNTGIMLRAYAYIKMLGKEGLKQVSEIATLNANYVLHKLKELGIEISYPKRRATHEFLISFKKEAKKYDITAKDLAKRILDYGFHAPTTYFPLLVPECWLIEPTETEDLKTLDRFVEAVSSMLKDMEKNPNVILTSPHNLPSKRLDDVKAAKDLDLICRSL